MPALKKGKFDAKSFAIKDKNGEIFVAVQVLHYPKNSAGYDELNRKFPKRSGEEDGGSSSFTSSTGEAVALDGDWVIIEPLNTGISG